MSGRALVLVTLTVLLSAGGALWAETPESFTPESYYPAYGDPLLPVYDEPVMTALDPIMAGGGTWALGKPVGELQNQNVTLDFTSALSLTREVRSNLISAKGALLGTGVQESTTDTLRLGLTDTTKVSFSRAVTQTQDLLSELLNSSETRKLSLTQEFGAGTSAGQLLFERSWVEKFNGSAYTEWNTQVMGLRSGLGAGYDLAAKYTTEDDGRELGVERNTWEAALGMPFSGGKGGLGYTSTRALNGSVSTGSELWKLTAPIKMFGGTAQIARTEQNSFVNDNTVWEQTTDLKLPLPLKISFTGAFHDVESSAAGGLDLSDAGWGIEFPWLNGQRALYNTRRLYEQKTGLEHTVALDNLVLPLKLVNDQGAIEYHLNEDYKNGQMTRARLTLVTTPIPVLGSLLDATFREKEDITQKDGRIWEKHWQLVLPFQFLSDTSKFSYLLTETERSKNNSWQEHETVTLGVPLSSWRKGAELSQVLESYSTGGPWMSLATTSLQVPWTAFGTGGSLRQQYITFENDATQQTRWFTTLVAAINKQNLTLTRDATETQSGGTVQNREMLALQTPRLPLFTPRVTMSGMATTITDTAGTDSTKTQVSVEARPLDRLNIMARVESSDADPGVSTTTQQVLTELGLFGNVALRTRMDTTTRSDQEECSSLSQVQLRADQPKGGGVGLMVGMTNWDQPGRPETQGSDLRLSVGDQSKFAALTYQVTEYDPDKLQMYADPLVRVSVAHAAPQSLSWKFALADQQGRPDTERVFEMGLPALGGAFTVAWASNPLDRQGSAVMLGDRYDASLTRRVMGDVDLKFKYRHYALDTPLNDSTDLDYFQVELAGGAENKGGKIALGFCQGDFVPQPNPKIAVPASTLDLSYSRRWADNGRFVVTLSHVIPPLASADQDPELQGRLEYVTAF